MRVYDLFRFYDFQGGSISLKTHFSDQAALRVGFGLSANKSENENKDFLTPPDTLVYTEDNKSNEWQAKVFAQYIIYPNPFNDVKIYLGAGPYFIWSHRYYDAEWDGDDESYYRRRRYSNILNSKSDRYGFGFEFVLGAEWFFMKKMSLLIDYGLAVEYNTYSSEKTVLYNTPVPETRREESSSNSMQLRSNTVKIGLTIYF